jgi:hypothetical protein
MDGYMVWSGWIARLGVLWISCLVSSASQSSAGLLDQQSWQLLRSMDPGEIGVAAVGN